MHFASNLKVSTNHKDVSRQPETDNLAAKEAQLSADLENLMQMALRFGSQPQWLSPILAAARSERNGRGGGQSLHVHESSKLSLASPGKASPPLRQRLDISASPGRAFLPQPDKRKLEKRFQKPRRPARRRKQSRQGTWRLGCYPRSETIS